MRQSIFAGFTLLLAALFLSAPAASAPATYRLEANRSEVGFVFALNAAEARGSMPISASTILINADALSRSSVDVTVDVGRARTGLFFATEALKAPSVLNAAAHPTIRFRSTAIRLNGAGRLADGARVDGLLTVRGVTRPVTLNAALYRQQGTQAGGLSRLSFRLQGKISRSAFGASGYPKLVDDMVKIDIVARVTR
jgi:polyisoprenoid-binding protein YceI